MLNPHDHGFYSLLRGVPAAFVFCSIGPLFWPTFLRPVCTNLHYYCQYSTHCLITKKKLLNYLLTIRVLLFSDDSIFLCLQWWFSIMYLMVFNWPFRLTVVLSDRLDDELKVVGKLIDTGCILLRAMGNAGTVSLCFC